VWFGRGRSATCQHIPMGWVTEAALVALAVAEDFDELEQVCVSRHRSEIR